MINTLIWEGPPNPDIPNDNVRQLDDSMGKVKFVTNANGINIIHQNGDTNFVPWSRVYEYNTIGRMQS